MGVKVLRLIFEVSFHLIPHKIIAIISTESSEGGLFTEATAG